MLAIGDSALRKESDAMTFVGCDLHTRMQGGRAGCRTGEVSEHQVAHPPYAPRPHPHHGQNPRCAGRHTLPNESWLSWPCAALGNVEDQWYCVSDQKPTWEHPGPRCFSVAVAMTSTWGDILPSPPRGLRFVATHK